MNMKDWKKVFDGYKRVARRTPVDSLQKELAFKLQTLKAFEMEQKEVIEEIQRTKEFIKILKEAIQENRMDRVS